MTTATDPVRARIAADPTGELASELAGLLAERDRLRRELREERGDHALTLLYAQTLRDAARAHLDALDGVVCSTSKRLEAAEQALRAALADLLAALDQAATAPEPAPAAWELSDTLRYSAPADATDRLDDLLMHAFAGDAEGEAAVTAALLELELPPALIGQVIQRIRAERQRREAKGAQTA